MTHLIAILNCTTGLVCRGFGFWVLKKENYEVLLNFRDLIFVRVISWAGGIILTKGSQSRSIIAI
jgi:hypothetical protein